MSLIGLIGKYGNPDHLRAKIGDSTYRVWVEQRGRDAVSLYRHSPALLTRYTLYLSHNSDACSASVVRSYSYRRVRNIL